MPSRIVREGILTSEPVNSCSWAAEVLYRRLMSVVDDFGRYYAKPALIRAACYPLQLEKVSDSDIGKWLLETEKAGLVRVYPASDGKRYLEIQKFQQRERAKISRFPEPSERGPLIVDCPSHDGQVSDKRQTDAPVVVFEGVSEGEGERRRANALAPAPPGVEQEVWTAWVRHKGKKQTIEADRIQRKRLAEWASQGHDPNRIVEDAVAGHWQGLRAPDVPRRGGTASLAERRSSTIDQVIAQGSSNGRVVNGTAERVDRPAIPAIAVDLREQGTDDVRGSGRG